MWTQVSIKGGTVGIERTSLPFTAFGELAVANNTAFIQNTAAYNLIPSNFREYTSGTGTTGVGDNQWKVTTGTGVGGYGAIQSFRSLNYNAGQGGLARYTARFENNVVSSWQGVGLISVTDELSFGYNGTDFGIWHRYGGAVEVRTITVSVAASGSENLTLTLNGTAYTIPLTSGTEAHNAYEIETWLNANQSVWHADQLGDTVIISALSDGSKGGAYSFSSSTATGSIAQNEAGVTKTSDHIPQSSWNENNLSSWATPLDPTKGNVYQIRYQYLGFGDIRFFVENPETGDFVLVHTIKYANSSTSTSVSNPSLRFGMYCVSLGSTTDLAVYSASCALFTEGTPVKTRNPRGEKNTQSVTTSFTNILTIRNRKTYNNKNNQVEIEPQILTVSNESSKNAEIEIRGNTSFSGETNFANVGTNLISDMDTTANTTSGGRLLAAFTVAPGQNATFNLKDLEIRVPPTLKFTVTGRVTGGAASEITAALTWYEDL